MADNFLFKRISSLFALSVIVFLASIVAAYTIWQSEKLKNLANSLPYYVSISNATTSDYGPRQ